MVTFDLEGKPNEILDGLLMQPLGGTCVYINLYQLLSGCPMAMVWYELLFFFQVLADPKFIKIGSRIDKDLHEIARHFGVGLYDEELIGHENIGNRTGLGVVALLHCGHDHKVYNCKSFMCYLKGSHSSRFGQL